MNSVDTKAFDDDVALKYQVYNGLFLTLPYSGLEKAGASLPIFSERCEQGLNALETPEKIIEDFFLDVLDEKSKKKRMDVLFLYLQLIERQVVLFDAIEEVSKSKKEVSLSFENNSAPMEPPSSVRIVLTAHPTQFYPDTVLGIIDDLSVAINENNLSQVRQLLLQLGRTSFSNMKAPTPLSEAENLIRRYLPTIQQVCIDLVLQMKKNGQPAPSIEIGFWPGGDRDGNPSVTTKVTKEVAEELRQSAIEFYLKKMDVIKKRITFKGVIEQLSSIQKRLKKTRTGSGYKNVEELRVDILDAIRGVNEKHNGFHVAFLEELLCAVEQFGFYSASLDIRQASKVHAEIIDQLAQGKYAKLSSSKKVEFLARRLNVAAQSKLDGVHAHTFEMFGAIKDIQARNGDKGLHRYIVSHTEKPEHLLEVLALYRANNKDKKCPLDLVPLFESIEALNNADTILESCLRADDYKRHLASRGNVQTVMLGFSDGTKDGGYVACNVAIRACKIKLQELAKREGIDIIFFDGRGGPAARGGGNTGRYYQAIQKLIPLNNIQLTVQGQTISSHYGTYAAAKENLSLLLHACLNKKEKKTSRGEEKLLDQVSKNAHEAYLALRKDPMFLPFLKEATPLDCFSRLNIASRPPKRNQGELNLGDLRAITFVGAWAQMKLNVPGYYGLGFALSALYSQGKTKELQHLYQEDLFFQTLIDNAMQALRKSYLPLTNYLEADEKFFAISKLIREENRRTTKDILLLTQKSKLLEHDPVTEKSISHREKLILPLLVIQHCALQKMRVLKDGSERKAWEKLLLKSIPANINASRNSA